MVRPAMPRPTGSNKDAYDVEHELTIGFFAFEESYVSKVKCIPYESVEVSCIVVDVVRTTGAEQNSTL